MELGIKYQGKVATEQEVNFIRDFISSHPGHTRTRISQGLCQAWDWKYSSGHLKDQACRGYLLALERAGLIELPPRKFTPPNPLANRRKPPKIAVDTAPVTGDIASLRPLVVTTAKTDSGRKVYNSLIEEYHYLGYAHPIGENLKYLVSSGGRPIACVGFSSAPRHIGSRDRFIGWGQAERKANIHLIGYNTRFLILPWVKADNLASHILGLVARRVYSDWHAAYNHGVCLLETFVDTERFAGTCYKAANWVYVGKTTGRGKNDQTNKANRSIKAVWCYPVTRKFREQLKAMGGEN